MDPNSGRIYDLSDSDIPDDVRQRLMDIRTPTPAYWNGLETTAIRGTAIVADEPKFPEYWAAKEGIIGQRIDVVRVDLEGVNFGGGIAYMDNRDGSAWNKVTNGRGSPSYGHRDVTIVEDSFITSPEDVERVREANRKLLVETETKEMSELLNLTEKLKEMPNLPAEKFYPINRAARRSAERSERRNRALKKRKPNG